MSDEEITDDVGDSVKLGRPYYDLMTGDYIVFEVDGDTLIERHILTGDEFHSWTVSEFVEECLASEYRPVPEEIITNPQGVLDEVMNNVLHGHRDSLAGYESWEVRLAWKATKFEKAEFGVEFSF